MTTVAASTPSPQRRLAACCEYSDDGNCSPSSPSSPFSTSPPPRNAPPGSRFRASLPAALAKLLSLLALATFLSAAVHDSARSSRSVRASKRLFGNGAAAPFAPPWFCHERPCPPFAALASPSPDAYSIRRYRGGQAWASVRNINVSTYEASYAAGGLALAAYFRGDNAEGRKLTSSAGVPTLVAFRSTTTDFSSADDSYDVSVFLAPEFGPDGTTVIPPPLPSSPEIELEVQESERTAYVVQFGGFATGRAALANAARLALALERDGLPYVMKTMELAIYDPPTRFAQRHNEVWLLEPSEEGEEGGAREGEEEKDKVENESHKKGTKKGEKKKNRKNGGDVGVATALAA